MKNHVLAIILTISISSCINVFGQNKKPDLSTEAKAKVDSLWIDFKKAKHDTTRIKLYLDISDVYQSVSTDSVLFFSNNALELADKNLSSPASPFMALVFTKHKAITLIYIGIVFSDMGVNDKALNYYFKALNIFEELSQSLTAVDKMAPTANKTLKPTDGKTGISKCYTSIGIVNSNMGDYDKAIEYYLKSLRITEELNDKVGMARCYTNIGIVYSDQCIFDQAIEYYQKAMKIFENLSQSSAPGEAKIGKKGVADCYTNTGVVHYEQGSSNKALECHIKALKIYEELGNKKRMTLSYNNIGNAYNDQGIFDKAIEYYMKALKSYEELGNKNGMSMCYINIGNIHSAQHNYDKSLDYYFMSLKITKETNNKKVMSNCYNCIGISHYNKGIYDKAIEYYLMALKINEEINDIEGIGRGYENIGLVYHDQGGYENALTYYLKALNIFEKLDNKNCLANLNANIAGLHISIADSSAGLTESERNRHLQQSLGFGNTAYALAVEIDAVPKQNFAAKQLQKACKKLGRFAEAIKYAEIFITTQDSMFSDEKTKALAKMQAQYEAEKRELTIQKLEKEKLLQNETIARKEAESKKQRILIFSFLAGFIIILVFSTFLYRLFLQKKKANVIIAKKNHSIEIAFAEISTQKEEITTQRDEIEAQRDKLSEQNTLLFEQKKEITDSINYAKRIQQAVLPDIAVIARTKDEAISSEGEIASLSLAMTQPKTFVLFKPKDVVSGDFYWATRINEWLIITVADCTGHGVPGAFMSMLGVSFLNEIVRKKEVTKASQVLDNLRDSIIEALQQKGDMGEQKDGMDITLCALNTAFNQLQVACANNPLFIITANRELTEITPDKMPVGIHDKMKPFTNHEIQLRKSDTLYLLSDGYEDQFGGPKGKKFMSKQLKQLLQDNSQLPMTEQKELLDKAFENWKGLHEQVDDVTVMGVRI